MRQAAALLLAAAALLGFGGGASAAVPSIPAFDHVIVVVFENKETSSVLGSRAAPTFNLYGRVYARLTRYYAVSHPSLPNYLALVSGSTFGVTTDCVDCTFGARTLADTIDASGRTWKAYVEGLPRRGFLGAGSGLYAKKHNPFAYFLPIIDDRDRAEQIVPVEKLSRDVATRTLPNFALVVPNLCNSMHDCSVGVGDRWLRRTVEPLLHLPRTVIFHHVRRRQDVGARRWAHHDACGRDGGSAPGLHAHHQPLRAAEDDRGRLGPPAPRPLRARNADHRHLAVEGFRLTAGMRSARCWPLSPQRKPRATRRRQRIAPV